MNEIIEWCFVTGFVIATIMFAAWAVVVLKDFWDEW